MLFPLRGLQNVSAESELTSFLSLSRAGYKYRGS